MEPPTKKQKILPAPSSLLSTPPAGMEQRTSSRLLALPRELRNIIYDYTLSTVDLTPPKYADPKDPFSKLSGVMNPALLRANRQLHDEYQETCEGSVVLHLDLSFSFDSDPLQFKPGVTWQVLRHVKQCYIELRWLAVLLVGHEDERAAWLDQRAAFQVEEELAWTPTKGKAYIELIPSTLAARLNHEKGLCVGLNNITSKLQRLLHPQLAIHIAVDLAGYPFGGDPTIALIQETGWGPSIPAKFAEIEDMLDARELLGIGVAKIPAVYISLRVKTPLYCGRASNLIEMKVNKAARVSGEEVPILLPECGGSKETVHWRVVPSSSHHPLDVHDFRFEFIETEGKYPERQKEALR